ncbi:hypothetical protein K8Z61_05215 [Nocardioides sp. TRM66260-LWL]|uniref:hypothetical protein n=1 Tax=Nocardioides sp. TRM66260-LWL TaxID=2874478 RepID=UPI001CC775CD|nr:hypothetical protein [Nocardioides sp. TRM66260-LWL]MBZ5733888.1 hypothetical protein [Nocardioides sp. TRM66260-LWL]
MTTALSTRTRLTAIVLLVLGGLLVASSSASGDEIPLDRTRTAILYANIDGDPQLILTGAGDAGSGKGSAFCFVHTVRGGGINSYDIGGQIFVRAQRPTEAVVGYRLCDLGDGISEERRFTVKVVRVTRIEVTRTRTGFKLVNRNRPVKDADGRTVMTGDVRCTFGTDYFRPQRTAGVAHGSSKTVTTTIPFAELQYRCTTVEQQASAGERRG